MTAKSKNPGYNKAITEIEEIVSRIESQELDIDMLSKEVKRAMELISLCKTKLKETEEEVDKTLADE